eukprot:scaffold59699_cov22-Tisochrysis_lutea.AAC.3
MHRFDEFQTDISSGKRNPKCDNLYDVFVNIRWEEHFLFSTISLCGLCRGYHGRDDEAEHVKTMNACQDSEIMDEIVERREKTRRLGHSNTYGAKAVQSMWLGIWWMTPLGAARIVAAYPAYANVRSRNNLIGDLSSVCFYQHNPSSTFHIVNWFSSTNLQPGILVDGVTGILAKQ